MVYSQVQKFTSPQEKNEMIFFFLIYSNEPFSLLISSSFLVTKMAKLCIFRHNPASIKVGKLQKM